MSSMPISRRHGRGFTLVEMLAVAPLVILVIGGIIGLMLALISDAVVSAERNNMTSSIQNSLDMMERDVKLATTISTNSGTLPSPQGKDNGTAPFDSVDSLVLIQYATTANPYDSTRNLVYQANPAAYCGTAQQLFNPTVQTKIIYFRASDGSLYRRTIVPNPSTCGNVKPWQKNSCATVGSLCVVKDTKLSEGISAMTLEYFTPSRPTIASSVAESTADRTTTTNSVRVTLELTRSVAGTSVKANGAMRAAKANN